LVVRLLEGRTPNEFYIYKDYVLIVIALKKPIAINIKNKETVNAFNQFFETMWKLAKR